MRTIGRLILLGVAIALLAINIPVLITAIQELSNVNWVDLSTWQAKWAAISRVVSCGLQIFTALIALTCAIVGSAGFFAVFIALIDITIVVFNIVIEVQNGSLVVEFWPIFHRIMDFILPILYSIGIILLALGRSRRA